MHLIVNLNVCSDELTFFLAAQNVLPIFSEVANERDIPAGKNDFPQLLCRSYVYLVWPFEEQK